jgi:hypothetical protein
MRVSRQWRNLQALKRSGAAHTTSVRKPGDLALFCATCPQPGINVSMDELESSTEMQR